MKGGHTSKLNNSTLLNRYSKEPKSVTSFHYNNCLYFILKGCNRSYTPCLFSVNSVTSVLT